MATKVSALQPIWPPLENLLLLHSYLNVVSDYALQEDIVSVFPFQTLFSSPHALHIEFGETASNCRDLQCPFINPINLLTLFLLIMCSSFVLVIYFKRYALERLCPCILFQSWQCWSVSIALRFHFIVS